MLYFLLNTRRAARQPVYYVNPVIGLLRDEVLPETVQQHDATHDGSTS